MSGLFDLTGHVALVTGGNGGIGLGMAEGLARAGADVAIWGTNDTKNAAAVETLSAHGTKVAAFTCDVAEEDQVDAAFAATLEALGKVDSCFANAGVGAGWGRPFWEMPMEEWHRVTRVNLDGVFLTFRAAAKHMVERGEGGALIGTSSLAAVMGQAKGEHYAATKGGVITMIKALAVELARYKIRANALLPGWIETDMTSGAFAWPKFHDAVMPRMPLRRWGVPSDFATAAVYLATPEALFHTGDTLLIDGAYSIF